MGNQISWHVELAIKEDQLDGFQMLTREMVEFTRSELGSGHRGVSANTPVRSRISNAVRAPPAGPVRLRGYVSRDSH
jgi:hypothetical protein